MKNFWRLYISEFKLLELCVTKFMLTSFFFLCPTSPVFEEMPIKGLRYLSQSTDSLNRTNQVTESMESLTDEGQYTHTCTLKVVNFSHGF